MNMNQPRYDEQRQIYRDCRWCHGRGCVSCKIEADKEYKRQFPDGPKPIATFLRDDPEDMKRLEDLVSQDNLAGMLLILQGVVQ